MIVNDEELETTQERIAHFYRLVAQFRVSLPAEHFDALAGGYLEEIERMHAAVLEYLKHPASENPARSTSPSKPRPVTAKTEESALLEIIREKSRVPFRKQMNEYTRKRQAETITEDELLELKAMTAYLEATNIPRVKALIQLAELRGVSVGEVMRQLGINKNKTENS